MKIRAALSTLILVLFALGCATTVNRSTLKPSDAPNVAQYKRGNLIQNSSFEENTLHWEGSGCQQVARAHSGKAALRLMPNKGEVAKCASEIISLTPGHFEVSGWFAFKDLAPTNLQIQLRIFDQNHKELPLEGKFKGKAANGSLLTSSFENSDPLVKSSHPNFTQVSLTASQYPFDGGWLPETARYARLELSLKDSGTVWVDDLDLRYSKWNFPLADRVLNGFSYSAQRPLFSGGKIVFNAGNPTSNLLTQLRANLPMLRLAPPDAISIDAGTQELAPHGPNQDLMRAVQFLNKPEDGGAPIPFGISYNPYALREKQPISTPSIQISASEVVDRMRDTLPPLLQLGARFVVFRTDDLPGAEAANILKYFLDNPLDREKFDSLEDAHLMLIKEALALMQAYPKTELYFVPPWYNTFFLNRAGLSGDRYLQNLSKKLPSKVQIIWTGAGVRSLWIDELQTERYSNLIRGRIPQLWDNTVYARGHEDFWNQTPHVSLASSLEPFSTVGKMPDFLFLNGSLTPNMTVQFMTAVALRDNPNLIPEEALKRVLEQIMGERGLVTLLTLDGAIWKLRTPNLSEKEQKELRRSARRLANELRGYSTPVNEALIREWTTMSDGLSDS